MRGGDFLALTIYGAMKGYNRPNMVTDAEMLTRFAAMVHGGAIVEIGFCHAELAVALARGVAGYSEKDGVVVYAIDPHGVFCGKKGGRADRSAFYRTMIATGLSERVALIDLPSAEAAKVWTTPVGLLIIDGDRGEAAVQRDVNAWLPHLTDGGAIVFRNMCDPGRNVIIGRLLASGAFRQTGVGNLVIALRKLPNEERQAYWGRFADARRDLSIRAVAAGYDADFVANRLTYGSFVSAARRFMYVETPKAACTTLKHLVAAIEGVRNETISVPYHRETRRSMLIHQRRTVPIHSLLDVREADRQAILAGDPDWFVFAVVRNPYSRLVSVFESKVRLGEPGYRTWEARYGDPQRFGGVRKAFGAFVRDILSGVEIQRDPHLMPQSELILPEMVPYSAVFRLESLDEAVAAFSRHLQRVSGEAMPPLRQENASPARPWTAYYDVETADTVARFYTDDFERFGYDETSWKRGQDMPSPLPEESFWRREVVDRNAMIDYLFDQIEMLRGNGGH